MGWPWCSGSQSSHDPEPVWDGTGCVTGFDAAGGTVVFALSTDTRPGELYVLETAAARALFEPYQHEHHQYQQPQVSHTDY